MFTDACHGFSQNLVQQDLGALEDAPFSSDIQADWVQCEMIHTHPQCEMMTSNCTNFGIFQEQENGAHPCSMACN